MEYMYDIKEMLCDELKEIAQKGEPLNAGGLEMIDKLTHSIKSLATIIAMEESEYSNDGAYEGRSYRDGSYRDGSYRGYSQKRDSMGRYSRRSYMRGRSRDDDADKMIEKLERMMEQTTDPSVKQAIQQAVQSLDM